MSNRNLRAVGEAADGGSGGFVGVLVGAGLLNVFIAALLFCRLPPSAAPSLVGVVMRAAMYVCGAAVAGVAGMWFYWWRSSKVPCHGLIAFGLAGIGGWVWVPAIVLFVNARSPVAAAVAAVGAIVLAAGLRNSVPQAHRGLREDWLEEASSKELFTGTLVAPAFRIQGYAIATCIYAAVYAFHEHSISMGSVLSGSGAFTFAWEFATPSGRPSESKRSWPTARRTAWVFPVAVLVTCWALLDGMAHRGLTDGTDVAFARGEDVSRRHDSRKAAGSASGLGGYESIILWPVPQKKQFIPPLPARTELLAPGSSRPLVIRFDGAYWYFQLPETQPGAHAHEAHGTPLLAHIRSNNSFPLSMEAHQKLGGSVRLSRCREIEVEIESRADRPDAVALGLLLGDSTGAGRPTLYLGQQVLKSTLPDGAAVKGASSFETLRFEIPAHAKLRKFDEITVLLLPSVEWAITAPEIAVQQFQLTPR